MFEETAVFKIKDVPLVINVSKNKYVLFGLIMFKPPFLECDIGHYTAAIRINNKWEVFDDMRSQSYCISSNTSAVIHCILYIKSGASDDHPDQRPGLSINNEDGNDDTQTGEYQSKNLYSLNNFNDTQHSSIHSPQMDMHLQDPVDDKNRSEESSTVRN